MKIKDHPALEWDRWLRPFAGINLPQDNLDNAKLKNATCYPKSSLLPDHLELTLEHAGKSVTVSQPISDPQFAQQLCDDLKNNCRDMTIKEIGERNAP